MLPLNYTQLPYLDASSVFELVAHEPWAIFLDSSTKASAESASACFDVLAISPQSTLVFDGNSTSFITGKITQSLLGDPLAILQSAIPECEQPSTSTYLPGAYGYLSYDLARQYEKLPTDRYSGKSQSHATDPQSRT